MSRREALLAATERLIWKLGFEAMSPNQILRESGAGQGSMYHHFSGKKELAIEAMKRHEDLLIGGMEQQLAGSGTPIERIERWLTHERDAMSGCRLGRLANERSVRADPELRAPLERYFIALHTTLTEVLSKAIEANEIGKDNQPDELASMLISVVQGGYVMALATAVPDHLHHATTAAWHLLRAQR